MSAISTMMLFLLAWCIWIPIRALQRPWAYLAHKLYYSLAGELGRHDSEKLRQHIVDTYFIFATFPIMDSEFTKDQEVWVKWGRNWVKAKYAHLAHKSLKSRNETRCVRFCSFGRQHFADGNRPLCLQ
ncbi:hypothetical protein K438DRAFT_1816714, partial [Mycena galopus ATCC 62051]